VRSDEEFREFYRREMAPALRAFEARREAIRAQIRPGQIWAVAAVALVVSVLAKSLGPLLVPAMLAVYRYGRAQMAVQASVKGDLVRRVVEFACPGSTYHPRSYVPREIFERSGLFERHAWNLYGGEDFVRGVVGATRIQFSELRVSSKKGKKSQSETVFRGLFFVADFNRSFRGRTILLPDRAERLLGAFGRAFQALGGGGNGTSLVELEDPELERLFSVYSTDPVEARYVLSPSLMERLVRFRQNTGAKLRVSFVAESLHIALPLELDFLELGLHEGALDEGKVRGWYGQLALALGIVEDLDLNTRIWSKAGAKGPTADLRPARSR
jgi:hypothetical protein